MYAAMLALFGNNDQPSAVCPPCDLAQESGAELSPWLRQFGDHGITGSIYAPSYDFFFSKAGSAFEDGDERDEGIEIETHRITFPW